jgi:hypothetical protein
VPVSPIIPKYTGCTCRCKRRYNALSRAHARNVRVCNGTRAALPFTALCSVLFGVYGRKH